MHAKPGDHQTSHTAMQLRITSLLMQFAGSVAGHPAVVLCDTGASATFISAAFLKGHNMQHSAVADPADVVTLADGSACPVIGSCVVPLTVQNCTIAVQCFVLDMHNSFDVILGQSWIEGHAAVLDFCKKEVSFV